MEHSGRSGSRSCFGIPLRLSSVFLLLILLWIPAVGRTGAALSAAPSESTPAALIYAGWFGNTTPTPSFLRDNLAFLETQPFDGMVAYLRNPAMTVNVSTGVMTAVPMSYETIAEVMSPLVGVPFQKLTNNLGLIFGSTPPDFFDDWSVTVQNFANCARAAREAGLKGICFDNEQYFSPWGSYPQARYASTKSLQEYQDQARLRGRNVMEAMVAQFPEIVVLTLHGPYISEPRAPATLGFPQWQYSNELLGPFAAGFLEGGGAGGGSMDGGELYTLRTAEQFSGSYGWRRYDLASESVNCAFLPPALRSVWSERSSISFGVYDQPFGGASMDPQILRSTLGHALRQADRYVWFYAEGATFLLPSGSGGASQPWVDAIRLARADVGAGAPPAAPANLVAVSISSREVDLSWADGSENESGFEVERKMGGDVSWTRIASPGSNVILWRDSGLSGGTTYSYRVRAVNAWGASAYSGEAMALTSASQVPPAPPSNLRIASQAGSNVTMVWNDNSGNESGFRVERKTGTYGTWGEVWSTGADINGYGESTTPSARSLYYRVRAYNAAGYSAYSNTLRVKSR